MAYYAFARRLTPLKEKEDTPSAPSQEQRLTKAPWGRRNHYPYSP